MYNRERQELKRYAAQMKPVLSVGKEGITETLLDQVERYLKKHVMMKVKLAQAANKDEVKEQAEALAVKGGYHIIEIKGSTVVLYRDS